jgi:hypothetical protein
MTNIECPAAPVLQEKSGVAGYGRNAFVLLRGFPDAAETRQAASLLEIGGAACISRMGESSLARIFTSCSGLQYQAFHARGAAGLVVALDQHGAQTDIAIRRLEARRHSA